MKLLIINSEYPPVGAGAGNASANIARELVAGGNEVVVVTAGFGGLPDDEIRDGVRILRGPSVRRHISRSTAMEQAVFILGATFRCLRLLKDFRPAVTLAFFGLPSGAVGWTLKRLYRIPYVVSLRGGDVPGFRPYDFWLYHRLAVPFLRVIWHEAAAVVANSRGLRELGRAFDSSIDIAVIPNGVDPDSFSAADHDWSKPAILSVGRIVHQKGMDLALMALSELQDLSWTWRIVGDGPEIHHLRAIVQRDHLGDRVTFTGWVGAAALNQEYKNASVFVFPSRHEGMPNAMLEAMASGLPVIASRIAGNEELVVPGETGILVPPDDASALREAVRQLIENATLRAQMGRAARRRVEEKYCWRTTADSYLKLLEKAIQ